jgi:hypothetical protein
MEKNQHGIGKQTQVVIGEYLKVDQSIYEMLLLRSKCDGDLSTSITDTVHHVKHGTSFKGITITNEY